MSRKIEIRFLNRKLDGTLDYALGSDGTQRLDGRLSVASAMQEAFSRAYNLRAVQNYEAFAIFVNNVAATKAITLPNYRKLCS